MQFSKYFLFIVLLISASTSASAELSNSGLVSKTSSMDPQQQLLAEQRRHFNDPEQLQEAGYKFETKGFYEQAIAIYQDIITRFPKYKNRPYLKDRLGVLRDDLEFDYVASQARAALMARAKSKEELAIIKSKTTREEFLQWRATSFALRMPLKVFIHPAKGKKGYRPELHNILVKSFAEWPKISDGKIQLQLVNAPQNADIECFWTDKKSDLHNEAAAGITSYDNVGHSKIFVLTMLSGAPIDSRFARSCCLHEFGHALGLSHSRNPEDIMCGFGKDVESTPINLSKTDKLRLLKMYSKEQIEEGRRSAQPFVESNIRYADFLSRSTERALALKIINEALAYDKSNVKALLVRSAINVRCYRYSNAISDLYIVEKLDPQQKRIILAKRALINVFRGNYTEARKDFSGALDAGFIAPSYYAGLAITKVLTRDDVDILKNLDDAILRSRHDSTLQKIRGLICFLEGDTNAAIECSNTYFAQNNWKDPDAIEQALLLYFWNRKTHNYAQAEEILSSAENNAKTSKWKTLIRFLKGEITEQQLRQDIGTNNDTIDLRLWTALARVKPGEELASKEIVQSIDEKLCTILSNLCWREFYDFQLRASIGGEPLHSKNHDNVPDSESSDHPDDGEN